MTTPPSSFDSGLAAKKAVAAMVLRNRAELMHLLVAQTLQLLPEAFVPRYV
jgi:hypothetical protein